jgi:hypothetical protein
MEQMQVLVLLSLVGLQTVQIQSRASEEQMDLVPVATEFETCSK